MRIVVPHTDIEPETRAALEEFAGQEVEYYYVGESELDYGRLLMHIWEDCDTVLLVEHDIVIGEKTVDELSSCRGEWCVAPYPYLGNPGATGGGLGCTKFDGELMRRLPAAMRISATEYEAPAHPVGHWCSMDMAIFAVLNSLGATRCDAHAPVGHLSTLPSHGCVTL